MQDTNDSFCPHCGEPVAAAQKIVGEESFVAAAQGAIESDDVHVMVDGSEIRLYVLEESGSE